MNTQDYVSDWMIFKQTADRLIENIDYLISTIVD